MHRRLYPHLRRGALLWAATLVCASVFGIVACTGLNDQVADERFLNVSADVDYVGDASCATCHAEIAVSYQSHGMANSFYTLSDSTAVEDWSGDVTVTHTASGYRYTPTRDGDRFVQVETRLGADGRETHRLERAVSYVIGSGIAARTYVAEENGRLYELPLTWYTGDADTPGHWAFSPGYEESNSRFDRPIVTRCMTCHNGTSEPVPFADGKYVHLGDGIGCEQCHGPGELHVEARLANPEAPDSVDVTIVNPRHLSPDLRLDVCQQCHTTGDVTVLREGETETSFRPGRPLAAHRALYSRPSTDPNRVNVVSHAERMQASRCFIESGAIDCVTCHDPHEGFRDKGPEYFNRTCQTCHDPTELQAQMPTSEARTQHAASANCFSCHMPKVTTEDAPHASFTDHKTRIVRGDRIEGVDTSGDGLVPYFEGDDDGGVYEGMAYVVLGRQKGEPAAMRRGVDLLSAAETKGGGEAQFLLGFALLQTGDARRAVEPLRASVAQRATPERLNALAQALEASGASVVEPEALYRQAVALQPAAASIRVNLGRLLESQSRLPDAVAEYRAAIAEEPWLEQAHVLLGGALARQGDAPDAIASLRNAVMLDPDHGDALTNLAALLAQNGDVGQAAPLFARAAQSDPTNANARANYALFLINSNRPAEALAEAQAALRINPQQPTATEIVRALQSASVPS